MPSVSSNYQYLACQGELQYFDEDKEPTTSRPQKVRITIDEFQSRVIISTEFDPSTDWRWATIEKNQIKTEARNDSAEEVWIIDGYTGNYSHSGYFGKGYAKVAYYKSVGTCKPTDSA